MNPINLKRATIAAAIVTVCVAGYGTLEITSVHAKPAPSTVTTTAVRPGGLPDFSAIVDQNGAAVVNISTSGHEHISRKRPELPQFDPDDPFQFFRHFKIPAPPGGVPVNSLGSGFIIHSDGVILTNAHVVAGADQIIVKLTDRREFKAKLVGMDKPSDIAVLRIDAKNLPTVKVGDSSRIRVGEWVLAIGSPFGFENSATAGIVSAKFRSLPDEGYVPFIQTDVAVNPGNSGGPLFDLNGEVVGINSQIYSQNGGYQGLSFAIPIDVAMSVEKKLEQQGHIEHGLLGVTIQEVNQSLALSFGMKQPTGALVSSVEKGSAAERAGIVSGDVILEFNGKAIGGSNNVTVTVGKLEDIELAFNSSDVGTGRLGLAVRALTQEESKESGVASGLIVEKSSGPAEKAGIQPDDIIVALNGTPVTSVDQLKGLASKSGKHVALLVQRGEIKIFVPIDLS
jgi:serine protease Do